MPELPEVETVCRGLRQILTLPSPQIDRIEISEKPLRSSPSKPACRRLHGQRILGIERRAKYILFQTDDSIIVSHLGMTGSWRVEEDRRQHDHVRIVLRDGLTLTYHDARRFGQFDILKEAAFATDPRFVSLGVDPVVSPFLQGHQLAEICRGRALPIKNLIMDQRRVVGVGNIYASESLHLAGIHPLRAAGGLSAEECQRLAQAIVQVLQAAIAKGGTTLRDFRQAGGSEGYFQNLLHVYGREGEACHHCGGQVQSTVLAGRSSFWCPRCQPRRRTKKPQKVG